MVNKMPLLFSLFVCAMLMTYSSCDETSPDVLPKATMEGKNTFGCILNGEIWLPNGYDGTHNLIVQYDPDFESGLFSITTYRYQGKNNDNRQTIAIYSDSLKSTGSYPLTLAGKQEAVFENWATPDCDFPQSEQHFRDGVLNITRFDLQTGIISGTFEFTLARPGCDTIKATMGRFDMKL